MKRLLLQGTAIFAVASTVSPVSAAEQIKLGLGGYFYGYGVVGNESGGASANLRNHKVAREAEIFFKGQTTLDNGVTFGVQVELEAETCADQIDETYMFAEGGFGKLVVGQEDPASRLTYVGVPNSALPGHGFNFPTFQHAQAGGNLVGSFPLTAPDVSGDSEKLIYFTPRLAGLQVGISYAPEGCEEARSTCGGSYGGFQSTQNAGQQSEVLEVGANYMRKVGDFDFGAYAGYAGGDVEAPAAGQTDRKGWAVGGKVGYGGFSVGGSFRRENRGLSGSNTDLAETVAGVAYNASSWAVSMQYWHNDTEAGTAGGSDTVDGLELAGNYSIGPGILLAGGLQYLDFQDNLGVSANENEALLLIVGTSIKF